MNRVSNTGLVEVIEGNGLSTRQQVISMAHELRASRKDIADACRISNGRLPWKATHSIDAGASAAILDGLLTNAWDERNDMIEARDECFVIAGDLMKLALALNERHPDSEVILVIGEPHKRLSPMPGSKERQCIPA